MAPTPPPPSDGAPSFDVKSANIFDLIVLAAGVVVLIFSFINRYVSASGSFGSINITFGISAWHSWAVLGLIITFCAVAIIAVKAIQPASLPAGVPWQMVAGAAAVIGWLIILIRGLTAGAGASIGWSGWILLLAGVILAAAAIIPLTSSAGSVEAKLNEKLNRN